MFKYSTSPLPPKKKSCVCGPPKCGPSQIFSVTFSEFFKVCVLAHLTQKGGGPSNAIKRVRCLLTKAYCSKVRARISQGISGTQLGVLNGGYEIGIHSMRALAAKAKTNGDAILLLDFANAFNSVYRSLLNSLTARLCPELANLAWWLHRLEPRLLTSSGETVRSSSGTQQGCRLSNPLFALAMQYLAKKLQGIPGLRRTLFYWDDTALIGTPKTLATAADIIANCAHETGLKLR